MNRQIPQTLVGAVLAAVAIFSSSCRKEIDYLNRFGNGQPDCKACAIRDITVLHSSEVGEDTVVYSFTYNRAGDPLTVMNTAVKTGNPNAVFKYDKWGRLAELVRPYANQAFETWTKYVYNDRNQVIRDTQFIFGSYLDSVPAPFPQAGFSVSQFGYDAQDRIIATTDSFFTPGGQPFGTGSVYQYDANGNLIVPGVLYDSRLSILRTNKIWMFVCRNYSVDNGFIAARYNAHGFPLIFQTSNEILAPIVPAAGGFQVRYACN
ncbi:MAG TPA: RHS repeat domain-containing protein [Puia sp.]|nr:RHS repeat domain-containing protein [Puia sp.]